MLYDLCEHLIISSELFKIFEIVYEFYYAIH